LKLNLICIINCTPSKKT